MSAISNMPIVESKKSADGAWLTDTFGVSKRMSTYLVAFAVTNFESRSAGNITVWTRPGLLASADYALSITGKILRHYEYFFGVPYPLPKMDMIALQDFNAGAMENWGLITYRESAMLFDQNKSAITNKYRVATVVAHELAHQWFGNLVTPKWWDDLWLNEGFASYVEYLGVDHVEPSWQALKLFITDEVQDVFAKDSLSTSHQISMPVSNPDEINEIFDRISYGKGASIIRMMSAFLTDTVLREGLRKYLAALQYSNAEQSDLWRFLTEAQRLSGKPPVDVQRVMNSWTLQTGYPVVTLTRRYGGGEPSASLEQRRFGPFKAPKDVATSAAAQLEADSGGKQAATKWEVPVTYTWKSDPAERSTETRVWLHQDDDKPLELSGAAMLPQSDDDWMLVNIDEVGYYRANYDSRNWQLLVEQLHANHSKFSVENRAQLLDDILRFARVSMLDYAFAMNATKYLKAEAEYLPWCSTLDSFAYVHAMIIKTSIFGDWRQYLSDLIEPYSARYSTRDWLAAKGAPSAAAAAAAADDDNNLLAVQNLIQSSSWACKFDRRCKAKAKVAFDDWRASGENRILPAMRSIVYCAAMAAGDVTDWDFLWAAYQDAQNAHERDRILRALSCTKELWLLSRYLEWTFDNTKPIRRQDGATVLSYIASNELGRDLAFRFIRERWPMIKARYGSQSFGFSSLIKAIAQSMNTRVELSEFVAFYETVKNDVGTARRAFLQSIEEIENNIAWMDRNYNVLKDWLAEYQAAASAKALTKAPKKAEAPKAATP